MTLQPLFGIALTSVRNSGFNRTHDEFQMNCHECFDYDTTEDISANYEKEGVAIKDSIRFPEREYVQDIQLSSGEIVR